MWFVWSLWTRALPSVGSLRAGRRTSKSGRLLRVREEQEVDEWTGGERSDVVKRTLLWSNGQVPSSPTPAHGAGSVGP